MRIGILALQGAVSPHQPKLTALGVQAPPVRTAKELWDCDGLILPGGESTTLINLLLHYDLWNALKDYGQQRPMWGICAGSILMAQRVENPTQQNLGLVDITAQRNAYGRQNESFITSVSLKSSADAPPIEQEAVFIRAPRLTDLGVGVNGLAFYQDDPIVVAQGAHLLTTFHPELSGTSHLHALFAQMVQQSQATRQAG